MFSLNRAQIIGNLTRDPEMRYIPSGQAVCSFGVATNRRWRDKDGNNQEQTEFHDVVAWGKLAEIMSQILHRGNKVYIEGRLQTRSWDGQDGSKRQRTEIVADNFVALTPKGEGGAISASNDTVIEDYPIKDDGLSADDNKSTKKAKKNPPAGQDESASTDEEINLDEIPF